MFDSDFVVDFDPLLQTVRLAKVHHQKPRLLGEFFSGYSVASIGFFSAHFPFGDRLIERFRKSSEPFQRVRGPLISIEFKHILPIFRNESKILHAAPQVEEGLIEKEALSLPRKIRIKLCVDMPFREAIELLLAKEEKNSSSSKKEQDIF